jgi:MerC mercury resistance protein
VTSVSPHADPASLPGWLTPGLGNLPNDRQFPTAHLMLAATDWKLMSRGRGLRLWWLTLSSNKDGRKEDDMNPAPRSNTKNHPALDRLGLIVSGACAVHCALTPFIISLLPLIGLGLLADEHFEWAVVGISIGVGALSLLPSYIRHHRQTMPLTLFAVGLSLILVGRMLFEGTSGIEMPVVVAGALFIASAHAINHRLCRSCPACLPRCPSSRSAEMGSCMGAQRQRGEREARFLPGLSFSPEEDERQ